MNQHPLDRLLESAQARLQALTQGAVFGGFGATWANRLLLDLAASLEELHVLGEELREQNEELMASRQLLEQERLRDKNVLQSAFDAMILTDEQGIIQYVNRTAHELLDLNPFSLGKPLALRVAPDDRVEFRRVLRQASHGKPAALLTRIVSGVQTITVHVSVRALLEPGTTRTLLEWSIASVPQTPGGRSDFTIQDTGPPIDLEAFVDGMAHELNNTLRPVYMAVDLLLAKTDDKESQDYLGRIKASAVRAGKLVSDSVLFSKSGSVNLTVIQSSHMIAEMIRITQTMFPGQVLFQNSVQLQTTIACDLVKLQRVILGLCENARDSMPPGGMIQGQVSDLTVLADSVDFSDYPPGHYIQIEIRDSGTGIAPDVLARIFDPFFTTREKGKGVGLGLPLAQAIIKEHEGFIHVSTELDVGTAVSVYLPTQHD